MGSCSRKPEVKEITAKTLNKNLVKIEKSKTDTNFNANSSSLPNSDYNSTNNEFIRGELLGKGNIGECYSSLSLSSGKIGVIKLINLSKFDLNIEKAKTSIINEFNKINDEKNVNKNLNTYLAYQSVENNDNCKYLIIYY